jgi:steroid delta-isomerase-like uncharacterized protein
MSVTALLTAQIEQVWGRGATALVDTLYADSVVDRMPIPGQPSGRAAMKDVVTLFRTAMPDLRMELHTVLACGDRGVDLWTLTGTHSAPLFGVPATGKRVQFSGIDMVRVAGGRIAEIWHVEEMAQFAEQLGVTLPVDAAPRGVDPADYWLPDPALLNPTEARNLAAARRHMESVWGEGKAELMDALYAPGIVDMNPGPGQRPGIPGIADALHYIRDAAPDVQLHLAAYVPCGAYVADRWTMTGTHTGTPLFGIPAAGKRFEFAGMDIARFRADGRIDRIWHVEEFARLKAQLA